MKARLAEEGVRVVLELRRVMKGIVGRYEAGAFVIDCFFERQIPVAHGGLGLRSAERKRQLQGGRSTTDFIVHQKEGANLLDSRGNNLNRGLNVEARGQQERQP